MITASQDLKDIFYNNTTVQINAGCYIEYNMNQMLDNITANYSSSLEPLYKTNSDGRINVFKKLFPIDSIVKPFRPINPGVKYYVMLPNDHTGTNKFLDFRKLPYPTSSPRVYYPGISTAYKYWVTPVNSGVDVTVKYSQSSATVISAYCTGLPDSKMVFTTSEPHGLNTGLKVTVTGSGSSTFNVVNATVTSVPTPKTFTVSNSSPLETASGLTKTATIVNSTGVPTPTKPALANKIVVKFEKFHYVPANCDVIITKQDGTVITLDDVSVPSNGNLVLNYNGTSWSSSAISEPMTFASPIQIKSIRVTTAAPGAGRIIGLIEISAKWVKDISSDVVSFDIAKESSSSSEDLLPVGKITSNSFTASLAKYNQDNLRIVEYNRESNWSTTPSVDDLIYLVKNAEVTPFLKVFHANGAITSGSVKYDKVVQGTYYLDTFEISRFGDSQITALDGSKYLMETIAPDILCEDYPVTSIIMRLLDTVGFTNYNFNVLMSGSDVVDNSVPNLKYWWTDDTKTVWECIQELCRDIQMNAFFDENNVLQFYTRDYLYTKDTVNWEFYYSKEGNKLPNIEEFSKKEIASANQVKINWRTPLSSLYTQSAGNLWASGVSFLTSGGLLYAIQESTPAELVNFHIDLETIDKYSNLQSTFNFNGYFLIDSEIFEYDAIQYEYVQTDDSTNTYLTAWIGSEADWAKYRALSKTDPVYFRPTGKYRIKERGALGTSPAFHSATGSTISTEWTQRTDVWS